MSDPGFKVQLFRFVDAFPMLQTPARGLPVPGRVPQPARRQAAGGDGVRTEDGLAGQGHVGPDRCGPDPLDGRQLHRRARRGLGPAQAPPALGGGRGRELDLLGEACVSDEEARAYQARYLDLITTLPQRLAAWPAEERLESDYLGQIPRANVSSRSARSTARTDTIDFEGSLRSLTAALRPLLEAAAERNVF